MAKLPQSPDSQTVAAIYAARKAAEQPRQSRRLGASQAGEPCDRALWYSFRWYAEPESFDGRMLRLFDFGHQAEERIANEFHAIGCEIHLIDSATMAQFEFTALDGHLVCKLDGCVVGVPEAPKTWHVWECKTHNAKSFAALKSKGLKEGKPKHYVQCILAMELSGMKRCLYVAENKDTSELYTERLRVEECRDDIAAVMERLKRIINATEPPERISYDIDSWDCKYCRFKDVCHSGATPATNCRTCTHARPVQNGWHCGKHETSLSEQQQAEACGLHEIQIGVPAALKKTLSQRSVGAKT